MQTDEQKVQEHATELHAGGLNCAEAVLQAVLEVSGSPASQWIPRVATCFGAGVCRSKEELCGALSGGLMAMGCLMGRDRAGESWDELAKRGTALRDEFRRSNGSTRCSEILAAMGPQEGGKLCHALSGRTAALTLRVLKPQG